MKINDPRITFLVSQERTTIELHDADASVTFLKIELTPEQLSSALSRLSQTECTAEVYSLDKIGKKHECKEFVFEISREVFNNYNGRELASNEICLKSLKEQGMDEWVPDKYYRSQNSFSTAKFEKYYARTIIRRWINKQ